MKRLLFLSLATLALTFTSGCHFWKRGAKKPKDTNTIATDVEKEFKVRWIARRASELEASGVKGDTAQEQANAEFRERFEFVGKPGK